MRNAVLPLLTLVCLTCQSEAPSSAPEPEPAAGAKAELEPDKAGAQTLEPALPWIEDDYGGALAEAQRGKKPIVIDFWAAWCHTCLSMQQTVLRDPSILEMRERFVWLAIDTEKPGAAEAMARFPVKSWPTFYIISVPDLTVQSVQMGSTSASGFRRFLLRGEKGHLVQLEKDGQLEPDSALFHVRAGDRLLAQEKYAEAGAAYREALRTVPRDWNRASEVLVSQISSTYKADQIDACLELAEEALDRVASARNATTADFLYYADSCAKKAPAERARALRTRGLAVLLEVLGNPQSSLTVDDRSDALARARELSEALGDMEGAKKHARQQQELLDAAVAKAGTPMEELTFVWHRIEVYHYLGEGERLLDWVAALESRLPKEYDPPYRRAWLLTQIGKHGDALAPAKRALELAQGPRKGRILILLAEIYRALGQRADELAMRQATVDFYASLPEGQKNPKALASAQEELAKVKGAPIASDR